MERLKLEDFVKYKYLSGVKHSPDGKKLAFVVQEANEEDNKYLSNIWLMDVETEEYFQLTSFNSERSFLWWDNENIIFPDVRDSKDKEALEKGEEFTCFYKINIKGGEAKKFIKIPKAVASIKKVNEDTLIFTSSYDLNGKDVNTLTEEEKKEYLNSKKEEKDYEVLEEIPFWSNGGGFTNKKRTRLYLHNIKEEKVEELVSGTINIESFQLNEEKNKAVVLYSDFKGKYPIFNVLAIVDLETKEFKVIKGKELDGNPYPESLAYGYANFIDEDKLIFLASDCQSYGINENSKWYTLSLKDFNASLITPDFDAATYSSVGSDSRLGASSSLEVIEGKLYFTTTEGYSSYLNILDSEGNIERIIDKEGSVDGISINKDSIIFVAMRDNKLQELYKLTKEGEKQITFFNSWLNEERTIAPIEHFTFESAPGVLIDGFIMKPVDYEEGKKYPAILDIHGGPKTVYGTVFYHEMQLWANKGYVVFFCNPRGGDGKGNDFADIRGKYGTVDYEDLMKFTDEVIARYPFVDEARLGVTGGSYGGFMTNWIIGHTDRFKAAASQRSISNWISMFNTTDIGYYFADDQNGGATPWSDNDKLWWHSPLKYADRVKTPTLFIHSEQDYRCWLTEGLQMFTALKYHGVEARLCMFRDENHELSRSGKPKHRIRRLKEITDWFDSHL